jgi:hypothetical protein
MNFLNYLTLGLCLVINNISCAKALEFVEDAYTSQAPQELVDTVEKAAQLFEYNDPYEVIVPKKAGLHINPWNKFIAGGLNPQTKNHFIIINPEFFSGLPENEQLFLLGRNFLRFKHGLIPLSAKLIPYASVLLSILLAFLLFWLLGKTRLAHQKLWIKGLIIFGAVLVTEVAILDKIGTRLTHSFSKAYDHRINEMVVQKTNDRDAGIKAMEVLDAAVKNEINNGENAFVGYKDLFGEYAQALKK